MCNCFGRVRIVALLLLGIGCGNDDKSPAGAAGGAQSGGGSSSAAGAPTTGGTTATTIASSTGGTTSTTRASATGGILAAGGSTSSGGATSSGGRTNGGASPGAGGTLAQGGSPGGGDAGSSTAAAGRATGGFFSTGGDKPVGGMTAVGGGTGIGGTTAVGGGAGIGGTTGIGGSSIAGGAGRTLFTGGTNAIGGAVSSAGTTTAACGTQPTLRRAADCSRRLIGVALSTQHLSESAYTTAAKEFNYVTPENEMKWSSNEPSRGQFSFGGGDQIVSFANTNGMKVKGHALVWHNQLPSWVSSLSSADEVRAAMLSHIKGVVQQYKGKVQAWDVVNEAVSLDGKGMRDSVFYRYLGETFIDEAFKAAREADPDAKLYYNDYNCEGLSLKANTVFELVQRMKSRNVSFDGVGMQMHYGEPNEAVPTADFVANMQRYVDLGLDILLSEMDVHVCAGLTPAEQATTYHDLIAACVAQPRCIAATFWGISDKYSWLNDEPDLGCSGGQKPLGLLWDDSFKKKPAYSGVMNALVGL
jgi:endo-1,4-beta-xylanase